MGKKIEIVSTENKNGFIDVISESEVVQASNPSIISSIDNDKIAELQLENILLKQQETEWIEKYKKLQETLDNQTSKYKSELQSMRDQTNQYETDLNVKNEAIKTLQDQRNKYEI